MNAGTGRLIGLILAVVLTLIYTLLFVLAIRAWHCQKRRPDAYGMVYTVLIAMYLLNTAQLCVQAADVYRAFFIFGDDPGGPSAYFEHFSNVLLPVKDCIVFALMNLTDALMVWRLSVVWLNNAKIIAIPFLFFVAGIVSGVVTMVYTVQRTSEGTGRLTPEVNHWWLIGTALSVVQNIITPGLILSRLASIVRQMGISSTDGAARRYKRVGAVLMECGCLYTAILTVWIALLTSGPYQALWLWSCTCPTLTAMVPALIVIGVKSPNRPSPPNLNVPMGNRTIAHDQTYQARVIFSPATSLETGFNDGERSPSAKIGPSLTSLNDVKGAELA